MPLLYGIASFHELATATCWPSNKKRIINWLKNKFRIDQSRLCNVVTSFESQQCCVYKCVLRVKNYSFFFFVLIWPNELACFSCQLKAKLEKLSNKSKVSKNIKILPSKPFFLGLQLKKKFVFHFGFLFYFYSLMFIIYFYTFLFVYNNYTN